MRDKMPFVGDLAVREVDGSWELLDRVVYHGEIDTFEVPVGFVTDFATVPDFLVWMVNKTGKGYTRAAIVHDWLITSEIPAHRVTSRDTDGIFRRIMREEGVAFPKRWIMWAGVRCGSLGNKRRSYCRQFLRDLPMVTLTGVMSIPIAPAALLVLLTRTLLRPLRYL
jgi:Protein of unknown function (DUF1353)